ncbi:hypothetical protein NP233_g3374 [Leucocoprinus birnbaumii]|uniref:Uncharacterized protein n=1 Tax=Leucocoprinus birnbaumii TaxID=56174 RepID=A0AAD5VX60_9AGAR|nr:hypothetical protein NP233_g3374 [Leucocoprinus birnbaumii]
MEYQFTRGIQRPNAARLSLALSSVLHDSLMTDTQRGIAKEGLHREPPQSSSHLTVPTKTPHSVLSSGSVYSQESWKGPEAWAFNKPPPSSRLPVPAPTFEASPVAAAAFARPPRPMPVPISRGSTLSSTTGSSRSTDSSLLESARASSATSISNQVSYISLAGVEGAAEEKKEKKTKLKQMYKRASRSTKAFAKMFSRSTPPGSAQSSPSGGVAKRSSLKSSASILSPSKGFLNVDPFASESSASFYGLSPPDGQPPSAGLTRSGSSQAVKPPLSVDVQAGLQRSPSVSSPLGIPTSPLLNKVMKHSEKPSSIRGRHVPFPVNSSSTSLPLQPQRSRSASQSSITSNTTQATLTSSHTQRPLPRAPSSTSLRSQAHINHPLPVPPIQVPATQPLPTRPLPDPSSTNTYPSSTTSLPMRQRPRSQSVREVMRPRAVNQTIAEPIPRQTRTEPPRNPNQRDDKPNVPDDTGTPSVLDFPPPTSVSSPPTINRDQVPNTDVGSGRAKVGSVVAHEVHVVKSSPSMPAMRAAYSNSSSRPSSEDASKHSENPVPRQRPRAGSVRAGGAPASYPSISEKSRKQTIPPQVAPPPSVAVPPLPERVARSRAGSVSSRDLAGSRAASTASSRDPSPARPLPRPPPPVSNERRPSVPQISTQNLPKCGGEVTAGPIDHHGKNTTARRGRSIPRSPSLPELRPSFADAPPLPEQRANSQYEESRGRSHVRSPSMPTFPVTTTGDAQGRATRQPLPSGIAERLRSRARSSSRSEDRRPFIDAAALVPPQPPMPSTTNKEKRKPTLESIPSASTYGYVESLGHPTGSSTVSTASTSQSSPSPTVSKLLKSRSAAVRRAATLKSPSMPDLRITVDPSASATPTCSRRPHSPPPPLPQAQAQTKPTVPDATKHLHGLTSHHTSEASKSSESLHLPAILRPKASLTRPKELSYPPPKDIKRPAHARSNKEIAEEGDWDFLDRPPRPPRTPSVMIPATPTIAKTMFSSVKSKFGNRDSVVPPVPALPPMPRKKSMDKVVGMAL